MNALITLRSALHTIRGLEIENAELRKQLKALRKGTKTRASEIIDAFGGTTAVARIFDIKPPSVHGWRKDGIPADKLLRLALKGEADGIDGMDRRSLFPDEWHVLWPELADKHPHLVPKHGEAA